MLLLDVVRETEGTGEATPGYLARIAGSLYLLVISGMAELSLTLWLLAAGVNVQRWKDQAG